MYITLHAENHCKLTTVLGYKGYLDNHIKPFFKKSKLKDVTKIRIEQFIKEKREEDLSVQTINHLIAFIKAVFQKMLDDEIITHHPLIKVKKLKGMRKNVEILGSNLDTAKKHFSYYYPLIYAAVSTGMRQGELFALRWDKIDRERGRLLIDSNFTRNHLTTPKSNKSRIIKITPDFIEMIKEWEEKCPKGDKNLVFPNKEGNYLDPNNFNKRVFHPLLEKAQVRKVRFHDLRHTYVSLIIANNANIMDIQSQMGHHSSSFSIDVYGHILPDASSRTVNALAFMQQEKIRA